MLFCYDMKYYVKTIFLIRVSLSTGQGSLKVFFFFFNSTISFIDLKLWRHTVGVEMTL